jgi:hypothetical protein
MVRECAHYLENYVVEREPEPELQPKPTYEESVDRHSRQVTSTLQPYSTLKVGRQGEMPSRGVDEQSRLTHCGLPWNSAPEQWVWTPTPHGLKRAWMWTSFSQRRWPKAREDPVSKPPTNFSAAPCDPVALGSGRGCALCS